jgi:ribosomal protein S18 acetylase RimI-like enzyme
MSEAFAIRRAQAADAEALGRIYVEAWRETYAGTLPDKVLIGMSARRQATRWGRHIAKLRADEIILIALLDGQPVGFGSAGLSRAGGGEGEIYTLYVDPNYQGRGVGRLLMDALLEALKDKGCESAMLWVVAANPSRFFYEAMGGRRVAEKTERMWGIDLEQYAYRWAPL